MRAPDRTWLVELESAAAAAKEAETALHKQMAAEMSRLELERAFAHRKLNLMRVVAEAAACAENEEAAVAGGLAAVRDQIGWDSDSQTRTETLTRFASVIRATYADLAPPAAEAAGSGVIEALAEFEAWYAGAYARPFWVLFEQYIQEMPLVER